MDFSNLKAQMNLLEQNTILKYHNVKVTTGAADTEFTVAHGLNSVPLGYLIVSRDKAGVVYNSTTAWTNENIYLKCSVATVVLVVMIF